MKHHHRNFSKGKTVSFSGYAWFLLHRIRVILETFFVCYLPGLTDRIRFESIKTIAPRNFNHRHCHTGTSNIIAKNSAYTTNITCEQKYNHALLLRHRYVIGPLRFKTSRTVLIHLQTEEFERISCHNI